MKSASKAEKEGRLHDAYRLWTKASSVNGSAQAEAAIQKLQDLARETFLKGYRQENVNLTRAKAYWQEVLEIVPPGTTYHTKASAKLGWYSRYNR
jgi:O6-methylguanine-DNA--protein-cysteine methyltransferase